LGAPSEEINLWCDYRGGGRKVQLTYGACRSEEDQGVLRSGGVDEKEFASMGKETFRGELETTQGGKKKNGEELHQIRRASNSSRSDGACSGRREVRMRHMGKKRAVSHARGVLV